jgi:hypothetical protein
MKSLEQRWLDERGLFGAEDDHMSIADSGNYIPPTLDDLSPAERQRIARTRFNLGLPLYEWQRHALAGAVIEELKTQTKTAPPRPPLRRKRGGK